MMITLTSGWMYTATPASFAVPRPNVGLTVS